MTRLYAILTPIGETAMAKPDADLLGKAMTWWLRVLGTGGDDDGGLCLARLCGSGGLPAAFAPGCVKTHSRYSKDYK